MKQKRLALVALLLPLTACASPVHIDTPSGPRVVETDRAFAVPAVGGPQLTGIVQQQFSNAMQQDIMLATSATTPGQNMLRVQFFGPVDSSASGTATALRPGFLAPANIGAEMRQMLPGVPMQRSPYYVQNQYGPFGYAVGRSAGGDTCFYGWQRITSTGLTQTWVGNKGSIQIRLRLCQAGATEEQLLQSMYGFTIRSYFRDGNWNPYGAPAAPEETLGRSGAPVYPGGVTGLATVGPVVQPAATAQPRRSSASRAAPVQTGPVRPGPLPAPIGPAVPPPPVSAAPEGAATGTPAIPATPSAGTVPATARVPSPPACTPGTSSAACP